MEVVNNTQKKIWNILFSYFLLFWPYDVIFIPKTVLFEHFEQIFSDLHLFLNYNMEITP